LKPLEKEFTMIRTDRSLARSRPQLLALESRETPATLSGTIFNDIDFSNTKDSGEAALAGATVTLTIAGTPTAKVTDAIGAYSFTNVPVGTHTLAVTLPGFSTTNTSSLGVTVSATGDVIVTNFGFAQKAILKGFVFTDLNGNGQLDPLERVVSSIKVNLDTGNNGSIDATTFADANGVFRFVGVANGNHKITLDAVSSVPVSRIVTVVNQGDVSNIGFAVVPVGTLSGLAFNDANANAVQDAGEAVLAGVTVKLDYYGDGSVDQTITTTADGTYSFSNIPDGSHLAIASRTGYSNTTPTSVSGTWFLGQLLPPPVPALELPLKPGDPVFAGVPSPTLFGLAASRILSGYVYADRDRDGGPDDYEAELAGVTVSLDLENNGTVDRTTTTDTYGRFAFTGVAVGTHNVIVTPPAGFKVAAGLTSRVMTIAADSTGNGFPLQAFSIAVSNTDPTNNSVKIVNEAGTVMKTITPFATAGETRVATGDVNADGVPDYAFGTGPGPSALVRVLNGLTSEEIYAATPFGSDFRGGVLVSLGDLNGDGRAELVITPDVTGGPRVRVRDLANNVQIADFFGIDDANFRGGARAAIGDLNADGKGDLIVAAGTGGGPRIALFDGAQLASTGGPKFIGDFFAFEQDLRNGSFLASGDINGDGFDDLVAGAGTGGSPRITVFSGKDIVNNVQTRLADFFAGNVSADRTGARIAVTDLDSDGMDDIVAGYRPVPGLIPRVAVYSGKNVLGVSAPVAAFDLEPFAGNLAGIYVG
jgi:hypothetical protein